MKSRNHDALSLLIFSVFLYSLKSGDVIQTLPSFLDMPIVSSLVSLFSKKMLTSSNVINKRRMYFELVKNFLCLVLTIKLNTDYINTQSRLRKIP